MSFLDQIEKLQKKPSHVRRSIVAISASTLTGLVVIVWWTLANPFASVGADNKLNDDKYQPFSMLDDIRNTASVAGSEMGRIKDEFGQIKDSFKDVTAATSSDDLQEGDIVDTTGEEEYVDSNDTAATSTDNLEDATTTENYGQN